MEPHNFNFDMTKLIKTSPTLNSTTIIALSSSHHTNQQVLLQFPPSHWSHLVHHLLKFSGMFLSYWGHFTGFLLQQESNSELFSSSYSSCQSAAPHHLPSERHLLHAVIRTSIGDCTVYWCDEADPLRCMEMRLPWECNDPLQWCCPRTSVFQGWFWLSLSQQETVLHLTASSCLWDWWAAAATWEAQTNTIWFCRSPTPCLCALYLGQGGDGSGVYHRNTKYEAGIDPGSGRKLEETHMTFRTEPGAAMLWGDDATHCTTCCWKFFFFFSEREIKCHYLFIRRVLVCVPAGHQRMHVCICRRTLENILKLTARNVYTREARSCEHCGRSVWQRDQSCYKTRVTEVEVKNHFWFKSKKIIF